MKLIIILLCFNALSCNFSSPDQFNKFHFLAAENDAIVISCIKCNCIIDELNKIYTKNSSLINHYEIYGDTTCLNALGFKSKIRYLSQLSIDSISAGFYNMLIIKKQEGKTTAVMVKTEDTEKMIKYLKY